MNKKALTLNIRSAQPEFKISKGYLGGTPFDIKSIDDAQML